MKIENPTQLGNDGARPVSPGNPLPTTIKSGVIKLQRDDGQPVNEYTPLDVRLRNPGSDVIAQSVNGQPDTAPKLVKGYQSAIFDLNMGWKTVHFEVSYDGGGVYFPLEVQRFGTGSREIRIDMGGRFLAQLRGATHVRLVGDDTDGPGGVLCSTTLIPDAVPPLPELLARKQLWYPRHARLQNVTLRTLSVLPGYGQRDVQDMDLTSGRLFCRAGGLIQESTDEGATWATLHDFGNGGQSIVRRVLLHESGALIAVVWNQVSGKDEVWKSNAGRTTWAKKTEWPAEGNISNQWGTSIHGDVVVVSPYINKPVAVQAHVRLSRDGGETWTAIFAAPNPAAGGGADQWHFHDVLFDPYRNTIWASNGDDFSRAGLRYSEDWGVTWRDAWTPGTLNTTQPTTLHPMPDMLLLGSDQAQFSGFHRAVFHPSYTPDQGTAGQAFTVETAYATSKPGTWMEGTYRGHQFDQVGAVYCSVGNGLGYRVMGTRDGVRFYDLFSFPKPGLVHTVLGGAPGGRMVMQALIDGAYQLAVADSPEWLPL